MFDSVLPRQIDNHFQGRQLAVWLFLLVVLMRLGQAAAVLFGGASVVTSADGVPLDTYAPAAAQTILSLWALLGLTRLIICLLCLLVVFRYRSLIPFMLGLLVVHDIGRYLVFHFIPIARVGAPPGPTVNLGITVLTIVGLVLSLVPRANR